MDNHDVTRIASNLSNEKHLPLIYAMAFGMPGIPCVYYGSEWGAKAHKNEGDPALRACFDEPEFGELAEWISKLAAAKKNSQALNYGSFRTVVLTNHQCIFERACESERVLVAINASDQPYTAHFDAGCGTAVDLISGEMHDFGGGSVMKKIHIEFSDERLITPSGMVFPGQILGKSSFVKKQQCSNFKRLSAETDKNGNDASENIGIFMEESYKYNNVSFIIKRNPRQESKEEWLGSVRECCQNIQHPRDGKTVYIGQTFRNVTV